MGGVIHGTRIVLHFLNSHMKNIDLFVDFIVIFLVTLRALSRLRRATLFRLVRPFRPLFRAGVVAHRILFHQRLIFLQLDLFLLNLFCEISFHICLILLFHLLFMSSTEIFVHFLLQQLVIYLRICHLLLCQRLVVIVSDACTRESRNMRHAASLPAFISRSRLVFAKQFHQFLQKFLGVRANICHVPCTHVKLNHGPILRVLPQRLEEPLVLIGLPAADALTLGIQLYRRLLLPGLLQLL